MVMLSIANKILISFFLYFKKFVRNKLTATLQSLRYVSHVVSYMVNVVVIHRMHDSCHAFWSVHVHKHFVFVAPYLAVHWFDCSYTFVDMIYFDCPLSYTSFDSVRASYIPPIMDVA